MRQFVFAFLLLFASGVCGAAPPPAAGQGRGELRLDLGRQRLSVTDAMISRIPSAGGTALRVATGRWSRWPGIALAPPAGRWDLSPFACISADVRNVGAVDVTVNCRVDNPGADGTNHCLTNKETLKPGQKTTITVVLNRTSYDKLGGLLFGMKGYPVKPDGPGAIDPAKVTQLLFYVNQPHANGLFELSNLRATGTYVPPTAWTRDANPFFPFIDTFGQYSHKNWPGKTHSLAEMSARRDAEAKELAALPGPADWDLYGGWAAGPHLEATGFFRTAKTGGKWWLVDPEGRLFFSNGIDCVGEKSYTPIDERQTWFEDFPGDRPEFKKDLAQVYTLKGHFAGRKPHCISFDQVNLARKYGADWTRDYPAVIQRRLRSWGINTIGNWSEESIYKLKRTPYTDAIGTGHLRRIEGGDGYWSKFPDVYDPEFAPSVRRMMEIKRGKSVGDPWCIGYFSDNEMSWGNDVSLATAALKSPANQPAKIEFVNDLKKRYGSIDRLNQAWGSIYPSWADLLEVQMAPDAKRARADLRAFYATTADRYFKTIRDAIRAVTPHQLYLGCRFSNVNDLAAAAAAKYCDVVSYNIYKRGVDDFRFGGGADVPLLIGEFHFGALDRGMFHTGLVPVASQAERAQAYAAYVSSVLRHPQFVGCHWFKYQDEPLTGRVLDEENYQIGFIDVADTPYPETIAASRALAERMYRLRLETR